MTFCAECHRLLQPDDPDVIHIEFPLVVSDPSEPFSDQSSAEDSKTDQSSAEDPWRNLPPVWGQFFRAPKPPLRQPQPLPLLTEKDGNDLVRLLNEVIEIARRTMAADDVYLHYRDGKGWRARFGGSDATAWLTKDGPWSGLLDALRDWLVPIRAVLADNDRRYRKLARRRRASSSRRSR